MSVVWFNLNRIILLYASMILASQDLLSIYYISREFYLIYISATVFNSWLSIGLLGCFLSFFVYTLRPYLCFLSMSVSLIVWPCLLRCTVLSFWRRVAVWGPVFWERTLIDFEPLSL